jgi:rare lipoprotein A
VKAPAVQPPAPKAPAAVPLAPARIIGGIPPAGNGRSYRLQVGSFRVPRNAVEAYNKLKEVGLKPAYERNKDLYRVVLPGLKSEEIPVAAQKLAQAGFKEAVLRLEK